ncbi:MAG: 23S rRNA pseudouridine synthase [Rhodospirillaceae bacterium]|nr:MAG: 23S rRNA pseudouridine synthase [Rhodospirillaceae bacterium]
MIADDTPGMSSFAFKMYVTPEQAGLRLDQCVVPPLSRSRLKALILDGQVTVDGIAIQDPAIRLHKGQNVEVVVPAPRPAHPAPQAIPLDVVYEDTDVIVIDKPAGMVVHPAPGTLDATVVNALLAHCGTRLSGVGGVRRPGIVHRLDKGTSGLLVVAKTDLAHHGLAAQFAAHRVERAYKAVVWGVPYPSGGVIERNIGRHPIDRKKMAVVKSGGKSALTRYQVEQVFGRTASLIECRLATGRTHQIRVHMASVGHSLVGDAVYGRVPSLQGLPQVAAIALRNFPRQALHAYLIGFCHPRTGNRLHFQSILPLYIKELIKLLETH